MSYKSSFNRIHKGGSHFFLRGRKKERDEGGSFGCCNFLKCKGRVEKRGKKAKNKSEKLEGEGKSFEGIFAYSKLY